MPNEIPILALMKANRVLPWLPLLSFIVAPTSVTSAALTTLVSFNPGDHELGGGALVQGDDGSFYGANRFGGLYNSGAVFRVTTNSTLTRLYSFTGSLDGGDPNTPLLKGTDGYFYGTTVNGGANGYGTIFRISPTGNLTTLSSFTRTNGAYAEAGLVQGLDGNLYGTCSRGGANDIGTIFRTTADGTITTLYSFAAGPDGDNPMTGLCQAADGNLYGTTRSSVGPFGNNGTIFKVTTNGALTTLYQFTGASDGQWGSSLIQATDGNLYGTTDSGGSNRDGSVFRVTTNGLFNTLVEFGNGGSLPESPLVMAGDGNLYGTTTATSGSTGYGTAFKVTTNGNLTTIATFNYFLSGAYPQSVLALGTDGNLYGTTPSGGAFAFGTAFVVSTNGTFSTLLPFGYLNNSGASPQGALVQADDAVLYGTTSTGGAGYGTIFKMSTNGLLTLVYTLTNGNGSGPSSLVQRSYDSHFYGTTTVGLGSIFTWSTVGFTNFSVFNGNNGSHPQAPLVEAADGNFYSTTLSGGTGGWGTVFKMTFNGRLTSLHSLDNTNDGSNPNSLIQGTDGNFFGTAQQGGADNAGTVFRISSVGTWTTLYSFVGADDGYLPHAALVQDAAGNLYGTTAYGGTNGVLYDGYGTIFRITTNGLLTTLASFAGTNGCIPQAALVFGSDGNLYGTTSAGGLGFTGSPQSGFGTIFKVTTNGLLSTLAFFNGTNGSGPQAALALASDGNFYGTTYSGGYYGAGTIFRLSTTTTVAPVITALTRSAGAVLVTWSALAGLSYQLQCTADLNPATWMSVGGPMTATNSVMTASDPVLPGQSRRFYRVVVLP